MARTNPTLDLLRTEELVKTGPVDMAAWNYKPILGWIQRLRFRLVLSLFPAEHGERLLEVGYGSGVFLPTLAKRAAEVWGIDPHTHPERVAAVLRRRGIEAKLLTSGAEALPFPDDFFDRIVAVSSLEFVDDLDAACGEFARVLRPGGCLIAVTPGSSPVIDAGLHLLTGRSAEGDFEGRRQRVIPALTEHLALDAKRDFPPFVPGVRLYSVLRLRRRPGVVPPGSGRERATPTPATPQKFA